MSIPKVTVLMPVYNGEKYLKDAIDSILSQSFNDFEFLIINDGSTDTSAAIIKSYTDPRIKLVENNSNIGLIASLNKGIEMAAGEYIARMDCDDICLPERLEKQVEFLDKNPAVCIISSHVSFIDEKGNDAGYWREDMNTKTVKEIHNFLPIENCIAHPSVMMRKSVIAPIGYNKLFKNSEDWGLWLTLISNGNTIAKLDTIHLKYRVHSEGTTVKINAEGPIKKILRFKFQYLKYKISRLQLKSTDYKVLKSFITGSARYCFPFFYALVGKLYSTNPIRFIKQFLLIKKQFNNSPKPISHIFFFPFTLVGGAERVHAAILETVAHRNPIAFIMNRSGHSALLPEFEKSATVINISELLIWPFTKKWLVKKISVFVQNNKHAYLFGSNSHFYYELLSKMPEDVKAIDLIHAFMHEYEDGAEKWSLPVVDKLVKRIVITQKTGNDLKKLYARNNIPEQLANRIVCIPNFTTRKDFARKDIKEKLKILYVGRGTEEKRVEIISHAAKILLEKKKANIEFHFAGNVTNAIPKEDLPYCILHGEISNETELNKLYAQSHILLITSSREGFPMSIMEAMMSGVVPVSTNVGGIAEHIANNVTGVLLKNTEANNIIEEIVTILEHFISHRDELNVISENAYKYAVANFEKKKFVESYQNIIDK